MTDLAGDSGEAPARGPGRRRDETDAEALAATTREVYEAGAVAFDARRPRSLFERGWLDRFLALVPPGAPVLDLGCGAGEPIAAHLMAQGRPVTGVDLAPAMLAIARSRWPGGDWREGDMRALDLPERFGGIVAWDSFFHLTAREQRAALPRIAAHLAPGGALLLTVGPGASTGAGSVAGRPVHHASLDLSDYAAILERAGLQVRAFVAEDPDCDRHSVLLARRDGGPSA